ncbi:hypothetical protein LCGC14_1456820 [marine sediment metagenome]|uniref:DNA-directed DNA polymerase family A palm domain-containing protein n=1 Tax=marine sediment metagenome TaxID=412755 RepID=A0A0F9JH08_9ZZZZ
MTVTYVGNRKLTKELLIEQLVDSPPAVVAIDVETISLEERQPLGFAIAISPTESWWFSTYPEVTPEVELIERSILMNPQVKKVFHNAPFDLRALPLVIDIDRSNIADTNVMARLNGEIETSLAILAPILGKIAESAGDMLGPGKTMLDLDPEVVADKCGNDARITLALYWHFLPSIDQAYFAVEMESIPILIDMSLRGLRFSETDRQALEDKLEDEVAIYRRACEEEDFNPGSNQQVGYMLAKRGVFLPLTRSRKNLRVDVDTLEFLDDPIAALVLNYRRANKLLTTYIIPLAGKSRIYTEYNLDAVVGRISSSKMNMQNIPGANSPTGTNARDIFMPDSGVFTTGDFSQEHLRIIAYVSQDREMLRVYAEPPTLPDGSRNPDGDIHTKTARELGIGRPLARTINYAIPYGATAKAISINAKIRDIKRCSSFLDKWFETYRDAGEWIRGAQTEGMRTGWALPTLFGRRIRVPEQWTKYDTLDKEGMKRKCINYPILGSDGEIMKRALILSNTRGLGPPTMAITVHDSITWDGDVIDRVPREELEHLSPLHIPFELKQTVRWE